MTRSKRNGDVSNQEECVLIATSGKGKLYRIGKLAVLSVQGDPYEMGFQHGRLLKDWVSNGVVRYFGNITETDTRIRNNPKWKRFLISLYLKFVIYFRILRYVPAEYITELKGIADGSGISRKETIRASFLSEVGQLLGPAIIKRKAVAANIAAGGCTGIAVLKDAAEDGYMIHGKNTDYEGIGVWNRYPVVLFCKPDDGYAYVKITSAGLMKGNLSMNEHGLTLAGHFIFSMNARAGGLCFTVLENEIMRRARSLNEAIDIIKESPRTGAFSFMISDAKTNQAVAIDCNSDHVGIRGENENTTVLTNVCKSNAELKQSDMLLRFRLARNPEARQHRAEELVDRWRGEGLSVSKVARILGDHFDPCTGEERAVGNVIAQISTVTSAIFRPQLGELWVATGAAPVSANTYVGLNLNPMFSTGSPPEPVGAIQPDEDRNSSLRRGIRLYGYAAQMNLRGSTWRTRYALEGAIRRDPGEPAYSRILGRVLLKQGDIASARHWVQTSLGLRQGFNERMEAHFLLGCIADLMGNREEALSQFLTVCSNAKSSQSFAWDTVNPFLLQLAEEFSRRPFSRSDLRLIDVSFSFTSGIE